MTALLRVRLFRIRRLGARLLRAQTLLVLGMLLSTLGAPAGLWAETSPLTVGETFQLRSTVLDEVRVINVYRPPTEAPDEPLPLLVMLDGGVAEDFLHIAGLVQISSLNGTMRPHLLVGIENTERRRDLTGPTLNPRDRRIAPEVGGSAAFRRFLRDELLPEIDSRYATTGEQAVVGESLAGLFVVETLLLEADLFDTYLAIDPSLWWNDQRLVDEAPRLLKARQLEAGSRFEKTLFLATADSDEIVTATRRLVSGLETTVDSVPGLVWHHLELPEEKHSTIYHPAALRGVRQVLAPGTRFLAGQRKTTLATVQRAELGDRGCYLELVDGDGEPFRELGDFTVCEQAGIQGKRVTLGYTVATVPSPECGGDPECGQTEEVVLVDRLDVLRPWVPSHCQEGETPVFSCGSTEQRVVSLCASPSLTADAGTLQLRFGPYGDPPTTQVPSPAAHPKDHFVGGTWMFSGGGGAYLKLEHGESTWVVFTALGKGWEKEGALLRVVGQEPVELPCRSEWTSEIGPELFDTVGIPIDQDTPDVPFD